MATAALRLASPFPSTTAATLRCGLTDLIGGDFVRPDLGRFLEDVEKYKSLAIYPPHEGRYEGRCLTRLHYQGYRFLDLSARPLGDPETTLTKIHPVCPPPPFGVLKLNFDDAARTDIRDYRGSLIKAATCNLPTCSVPYAELPHLGRQPIARWYFPPEVDYRLSLLPPNAKGLVVWIIEAKVLSKAELQFLALLPSLRPKVRVIAECGNWRKFLWKPLREIAGLPSSEEESQIGQPSQ